MKISGLRADQQVESKLTDLTTRGSHSPESSPQVIPVRGDGGSHDSLPQPSVPSLFRQTAISSAKRCEPTRTEIPAQRHDGRYGNQRQKFELHSDVTTISDPDMLTGKHQPMARGDNYSSAASSSKARVLAAVLFEREIGPWRRCR